MFDYYTIEEVADKSDLNVDQILRLGMSGTIIFSILEHRPKNYEEINDYIDKDGEKFRRTRRSETSVLIGKQNPGLQIKYISTEDLINVVTNADSNKNTLIRGLFETRELDPKSGKWMFNNPLSISHNDLIIKSDEWELFEQQDGKKLADYLPLKYPEKVTIPWLSKNVSISAWLAFAGLCVSIFLAGIYVAESKAYNNIFSSKVEKLEGSNIDE